MYRNQYDTDATTFSPAGRLHQVEYAMEALNQGSATVGVRSKDYVVLASLKRSASELASYQRKTWKVDEHMGIAIAGLVADARVIAKYMRDECLNHRYVYESPMQVGRLVKQVSDQSQRYTQRSEKRPYGVGLLVAGYDKTGPHLYQTVPSGCYYEYYAQAMGARSQGAKTYLEKVFETFPDASLEDLMKHALTALKAASQKSLTSRNCTIAFVGRDHPFQIIEGDSVKPYVLSVRGDEGDESGGEEDFSDDEKEGKEQDQDGEQDQEQGGEDQGGTDQSKEKSKGEKGKGKEEDYVMDEI